MGATAAATANAIKREIRRRQAIALLKAEKARRDDEKEQKAQQSQETPTQSPPGTEPLAEGSFTPGSLINPDNGLNTAEASLVSIGKGMNNVIQGSKRLFNAFPIIGDAAEGDKIQAQQAAENQTFQQVRDEFPIASFIGELIGEVAAFPVGGVGKSLVTKVASSIIPSAFAASSAEAGRGSDLAESGVSGVVGAVFGPVGEGVAHVLSKSAAAATNLVKKLFKDKTGGALPSKFINPDGVVTEDGIKLMDEIGISKDELAAGIKEFGGEIDKALPDAQAFRLARAKSEGVDLSRGQATADAGIQTDEQALAGSLDTNEGVVANQLQQKTQSQLDDAAQRFRDSVTPDETATRTGRGLRVSSAVFDAEENAKLAVDSMYKKLRELPGGGERLGDVRIPPPPTPPGTPPITTPTIKKLLVESKEKIVRKYAPRSSSFKKGIDAVFEDFELLPTEKRSPLHMGPLTFSNAFEFRARLGKLKPQTADEIAVIAGLKEKIDAAVSLGIEQFPNNKVLQDAAEGARKEAQTFFETFEAKDIIQELNAFKKGTRTEKIPDSVVIDKIFGSGNQKIENLKRVKGVLVTGKGATEESKQAFEELQTQAVLDILDGAINPDTLELSGRALKRNIDKFGDEGLQILLGSERRLDLKKLASIAGDATTKLAGDSSRPKVSRMLQAVSNILGAGTALKYGFVVRQAASTVARTSGEVLDDKVWRQAILEGIKTGASAAQKENAIVRLFSALAISRGATKATEDNQDTFLAPALNP